LSDVAHGFDGGNRLAFGEDGTVANGMTWMGAISALLCEKSRTTDFTGFILDPMVGEYILGFPRIVTHLAEGALLRSRRNNRLPGVLDVLRSGHD